MKRNTTLFAAIATTAALVLSACSTGAADEKEAEKPDTKVEANAFPVTIEHKLGATTIEKEPKRVVTIGWTDQDNVLSLGVVPVGSTKLTWGGNDNGSSDWFDERIQEMGVEAPVRFDDTDGIPFKEIAKLNPDLIIGTNSGIDEKDYKELTEIADTVAYPEAPWVTDWQTQMEMVGKALGRSEQAAEVVEETEAALADAREASPGAQGKSLIFAFMATTDMSTIGVYAPQDPRVAVMHDLGLVDAPAVADVVKDGEFYGQVSAEKASELDSDVLLTYAEAADDLKTYADHNLIGEVPAIKSGHAYAELDKHIGLSVTNPSPLSIPFIIENFWPKVVGAIEGS